jgi:hypothetical protein
MSDTEYSLRLTGNGVTLDRKISKELGERVAMLIISDGKANVDADVETKLRKDTSGGTSHGGAKPTLAGKTSLREYINSHNAKKIPQQIVAIGSYYQAKNGAETFTRDELENGFQTGKVPPPGNLPRDIATTISRGWIAEADEDDQYYVTSTGETALAGNFAKEVAKAGGGRRRKRRNKKATTK